MSFGSIFKKSLLMFFLVISVWFILAWLNGRDSSPAQNKLNLELSLPYEQKKNTNQYVQHKNITSTIFWVGESADSENDYISNSASAWDDAWQDHYGGMDDPSKRQGFFPTNFTPKENPFYVALPYNDFLDHHKRDPKAYQLVYWAKAQQWNDEQSLCKNQWVKIQKGDKAVYAQWEDVGPFETSDASYVFGSSGPSNNSDVGSGIDVSPAVRDYLGLEDVDNVDWQFVNYENVPDGPWKQIVTTSQVFWQ